MIYIRLYSYDYIDIGCSRYLSYLAIRLSMVILDVGKLLGTVMNLSMVRLNPLLLLLSRQPIWLSIHLLEYLILGGHTTFWGNGCQLYSWIRMVILLLGYYWYPGPLVTQWWGCDLNSEMSVILWDLTGLSVVIRYNYWIYQLACLLFILGTYYLCLPTYIYVVVLATDYMY